jgi:CSLREA domain-containing protein
VATQPNGKILLGGDSFQGTHILFALERYNKNGSRDLTFGVDGRVATAFGSNGQAGSLVLQRDGKILQAGMSYFPATGFDIAMVRYLGDETLTVNKTADTDDGVCNSDCSLREAIDAASTGGTINFVPSLSGQTILLGSTLLIDKDVHIDGSGLTSQVTVSGNDRVPVLEIRQGTTVTINRLIVSNGYTEDWQFGAGLLNDGTLLITNSTIKDNVGREGGGIRNLGALEIVNSMVSNNSADNVGGGILNYGTLTLRNSIFDHNSSAAGGGILNEHGATEIQDSSFSDNAVTGPGGAVHITSGTLNVESVAFTNNSAESGGALYYNVLGTFEVKNSTFYGNSAVTGGAIATVAHSTTVTNSVFSNNSASNGGGGIYNGGETLSIIDSSFHQNSALVWGGGIANHLNGNLTISNSRLVENSAWNGGGISNAGSLTIQKTEFLNNSALSNDPMKDLEGGGGIYNDGGNLTIADSSFIGNTSLGMGGAISNAFLENSKSIVKNSTFSGNSASVSGGGISSHAVYVDEGFPSGTFEVINSTFSDNTAEQGGGAFNSRAILTVKNSTLSGNQALQGGAIYNDLWGGTLHLSNSILANSINLNSHETVEDCYSGADGMGSNIRNIVELNAVGDNTCGVPFVSADPALNSLANNGGFTQTLALLPRSPAINAGDDASCPAVDQRGVPRPQGTHCDIGAYETEGTIKVSIGGTEMHTYPLVSGESLRVSFSGVSNGPVKITDIEGASFMAAERVVYKVSGVNTSFTEMMGLPNSQIDTTYWLPWYNNATPELDTQLRFANVSGSSATVHVHIGGVEMTGSPFTLLAGESTRKSFNGINNGPVKIESNVNIVAAERVVYKAAGGIGTSFSEMMALPNGQRDTTYWLPWYNNATAELDTQLRFANASDSTATVHVYIGGAEMTGSPFTLGVGESTRKSFAGVSDGPVRIESDVPIVAAERVVYKAAGGVGTSFTEMMGLPAKQLDTTYWLPWYNNTALDTQLRFANVSNTTATVHVYIGGAEMLGSPFLLDPGASTRQSFAEINNGPVQIVSNVPIVAAERVVYKAAGGVSTSFSEMMALPNAQLDTTYWLPWYNNATAELDTQLRFGVP